MFHELLYILEDVLGPSTPVSKKDISFYCPNCNHKKKKLQVSPTLGYYHCWVCHFKGRGIESLINRSCKLKGYDYKRISTYNKELKDINLGLIESIDNIVENFLNPPHFQCSNTRIQLPGKCISVFAKDTFSFRRIRNYLNSRGLNDVDLERYNIMYCEDTDDINYLNRIIIPSYDKYNKLNTFNARSIDNVFPKYREPNSVDKSSIIGFEHMLNKYFPIVLVEGMMDAMAVKFNSIPLFGTYLTYNTKEFLVKNKNKVYVCLDPEAFEYSLTICEQLMNLNLDVYHTILPTNTDPSSLGTKKVWEYVYKSHKVTSEYIFKNKILSSL